MINLERLARREFLRRAGLGVVGILTTGTGCSVVNNRISFEEAVADRDNSRSVRQKYIDQLVLEELGRDAYQVVSKFHYDHNNSLAESRLIQVGNRLYSDPRYISNIRRSLDNDPEFLNEAVEEFIDDSRFFTFEKETKEGLIKNFLKTQEGLSEFIDKLSKSLVDEFRGDNEISGRTLTYPFDYGKGMKIEIFIPKKIFAPLEYQVSEVSLLVAPYEIKGKTIIVPATEEEVRKILKHEFRHASDFFYGIRLNSTLVINGDNMLDFEPEIIDLLEDGRNLLADLEYARAFNKSRGTPFERYHPAYIGLIIDLDFSIKQWKNLGDKNLNSLSRSAFEYMKPRLDRATLEVQRVLEECKIKL